MAMDLNGQLTLMGEKTPKAKIYKHESHKLHQAFNITAGKNVYVSAPVILEPDGTVRNIEPTDDFAHSIGCAITDSITPAYPDTLQSGGFEVTIAMRGYMIVRGVSAGAMQAGFVKPTGNYTEMYTEYEESDPVSTPTDPAIALLLSPATAAGQLIDILLIG